MTTTELIKLLKSVEKGASGRSREISFTITKDDGPGVFIPDPKIRISSTGDGVTGAELCLELEENEQ